jgi:hypothetical protein
MIREIPYFIRQCCLIDTLQQTRAESHRHLYGTVDDNTSDFILIHLFFSVSPCLRVKMFFLTDDMGKDIMQTASGTHGRADS